MESQEEALKRDHSNLVGGGGGYVQSALSSSAWLAWLYVSLMGLSFASLSLLLAWLVPVNEALWEAFRQQVDGRVFQWQVAGFGGVLLLNLINLLFTANAVQRNCNLLLGLIHGVAFATDCLIAARATPVVVAAGGHMFLPLRSIQWLHTTPTMIQLMSMMGGLTGRQVGGAIAADVVMVLTGLAASWSSGWLQLLHLAVSTAAFLVVMAAVVAMFRAAMAEAAGEPASVALLRRLLLLTLGVWSLFPLVWLLAYGGLVSMSTEQVLWGVSDYSAKVVFSSHLWQKNLATVQQRREAAQELMGALDRGLLMERLRALLAAKERLVYALRHELTTPINGMLALVQELIHNKSQSVASRTKMLLMIRSSATCLLNTINTTLAGSSSGGGGGGGANGLPPRRLYKVSLWRVTELVLRLTRPLLKDNVTLVNGISRDAPPVKGDRVRLMQVLMNLVCACLKFTQRGTITISATTTQTSVQVVVADTGQGIPAAQLAHALDPFDQAAGAAGGGGGGGEAAAVWDVCRSGLGLYLVKQALAAMGSSLSAVSEEGVGSSFSFELPLADDGCDSESDIDSLSEAPSLRASLELADLDGPNWRGQSPAAAGTPRAAGGWGSKQQQQQQGGGSASDGSQQQSFSSKRQSLDLSLHTPSAAAAGTGGSSSTGGSSTPAPVPTPGGSLSSPAKAAAAGPQTGGASRSSVEGPGAAPPANAAGGSPDDSGGSWCGSPWPLRPTHRSIDGVIQVLSVDDDPVNQLVAGTALRSHKWEVVKAMSGQEALSYLSSGASVLPDLVLLDVMMPAMSGYEVAAAIRRHLPSSLLPIIMVSAKTEEDDIVRGLRCGADDYVTKPFKRAELAARIRAHIRARDAFQEQQAAEQQWLLQHNLLPPTVQRKLRAGDTVIAESHPAATVLWAEVLGVGGLGQQQQQPAVLGPQGGDAPAATGRRSVGLTPAEAVVRLNSLYTTWEEMCAEQDVLGVDFSGSTFVAVSGHDDNPAHQALILAAAARMLAVAGGMTHPDGSPLAVRIGIHTGPLTTGLVGSKAVKLVLMGDTVEVARQLAASGSATGRHISADVYGQLSAADKAVAMPWTLQQLPGSSAPQHTYLLPHAGAAAAAGWTPQQQDLSAAAAAGASVAAGGGREVAVGRMDRFIGRMPAATAAAAADHQREEHLAGGGGSASPGLVLLQPGSHSSSSGSLQRQASGNAAAADALTLGRQASLAAAAASGGGGAAGGSSGRLPTVVTAALPAPAPGGSVGFGAHQQQRSRAGSNDGSAAVVWASPAAAAAGPAAAAVVALADEAAAAASAGDKSMGETWLLSAEQQQPQPQRSRRSSATASAQLTPQAAVAAAVAAAAAAAHLPHQQQHQHLLLSRQLSPDAQQLQAASTQLLQQLGTERQQLQQQLLEVTQQAAAAGGELAAIRQQLADAQAAAASQALMLEALRQQLGQALMRAHLADCWRGLATLKSHISSIAGQEAAAAGGGAVPDAGQVVPASPASPATFAAAAAAQGAAAGRGEGGGSGLLPGDAPSLQQLLHAQAAQLAALQQQQQLLLVASLQQQQPPAAGTSAISAAAAAAVSGPGRACNGS